MKFTKALSILAFLVFLIGTVSAVSISGEWIHKDNSRTQSITINKGEVALFGVSSYSISPPAKINIKLYNSNNLIHTFEENKTLEKRNCSNLFGINPSMYDNSTGDYEIRISGFHVDKGKTYLNDHTLRLTVVGDNESQNGSQPSSMPLEEVPVTISGEWIHKDNNRTQSITINLSNEEVALLGVSYYSLKPPYYVNVKLYDSNDRLIHKFEENKVVKNKYYDWFYRINSSLYNKLTAGEYLIKIYSFDEEDAYVLGLIVEGERPKKPVDRGDTTKPTVTITYPENGGFYASHLTNLSYKVEDNKGVNSCWYSTDGGETNSTLDNNCLGTFDIDSVEGKNAWTVYAIDTSGNVGSATVNFAVYASTDDDDDDGGSNKDNYVFEDVVLEQEYLLQQYSQRPAIIQLDDDDEEPEVKLSFWQRIIKFFKELLGLK